MHAAKRPGTPCGLVQEVARWKRLEEDDRELKQRVAAALGELQSFLAGRRADLESRKGRVLQTRGFRDETQAMETALAAIEQSLAGGRNISRVFADVDRYLKTHKIEDTLSRLHVRTQLADARDEFMCAFHESIRGTRLAELLDILHFMPFAFWRPLDLERRNYRSPSAAETLRLLEELVRRGIDVDRTDVVQLAAIVRVQLGITPRMGYQNLPGNKLAEQLTSGENLTRFTAKVTPFDESSCRVAAGILANLRRWPAELFPDVAAPTPPELEAEMLQIAFLAADAIRISGTEQERAADYLWLLSTAVASGYPTLKDVLAWPAARSAGFARVHERIVDAKRYLDTVAALVDRTVAARWTETATEIASLAARSEALCSKDALEFAEFTELEQLRERRADAGKSLIKLSDSLQLIEPALLDMLGTAAVPAGVPRAEGHLRALTPGALLDRNRACAAQTMQVARQELGKLRELIQRIEAASRKGFAASPAPDGQARAQPAARPERKTAGGVELAGLPDAEIEALLAETLRKALASAQDFRSRIDGARKRVVKSDVLQSLNLFHEKFRRAVDGCARIVAAAAGGRLAPEAAAPFASLLRECLAAQTGFGARLNNPKLSPAEKQLLTSLLYAVKARLADDLREIECLRAELAERSAAGRIAELAAAANRALLPVKEKLTALKAALADPRRESATVLAAARSLKSVIGVAWEHVKDKRARAGAVAAACPVPRPEDAERFDRWQRQLEAADAEVERLLGGAERLAGVQEAACGATLLSGPLREARETCSAAARAEWRVLKEAAGFFESGASSLAAREASLREARPAPPPASGCGEGPAEGRGGPPG